jgi:hypothetical protein
MDFEQMLEMEARKENDTGKEVVKRQTTAIGKFDIRPVMADLKAMESTCAALVNEANALEITTPQEKDEAINISGKLQEVTKDVKKKCEDFVEPFRKVINAINGPKKRITEAATRAKTIVNQKIFQFKKQEEIDREKQQQVINKATEELQESLRVQAKELGVEAPKVTAIKAPRAPTILRGDSGASVYSRKTWKCEIVNPDQIERKFCVPSQTLLNQAVRMGVRKIAGCRIYKDEVPVTRAG